MTLSQSPSLESLASANTRASYSHDYASDDYESDDHDDHDDFQEHNSDEHPDTTTTTASTTTTTTTTTTTDALRSRSAPSFFGPPFYGRPPTPLPQTPSLTSLFRPSRPTTPDGSDDDEHHHHPHHHHHHHHSHSHSPYFHPSSELPDPTDDDDPAAAPLRHPARVPTYEYYGFVVYLFSSLCFGAYLLWAYLPSSFLHALGIYYYPNRWWALAVPAFLVVAVAYVFVALAAYNTEILAVPVASPEAMVDGAGHIAVVDARGRIRGVRDREGDNRKRRPVRDWKAVWNEGTDAVMDVPLAGVCEVLYGV